MALPAELTKNVERSKLLEHLARDCLHFRALRYIQPFGECVTSLCLYHLCGLNRGFK